MPDFNITCSRCEAKVTHHCHDPSFEQAVIELYKWRPESGFPTKLKKGNDYWDKEDDKNEAEIPFLSETFLYSLLGKEDARTLLSLVRQLFESQGLDAHAFEMKAHAQLDAEEKARKEELKRREEAKERRREMLAPATVSKRKMGKTTIKVCTYKTFYAFDRNVHFCESGNHTQRAVVTVKSMAPLATVCCKTCNIEHVSTADQIFGANKEEQYKKNEKYPGSGEIRSECLRVKLKRFF